MTGLNLIFGSAASQYSRASMLTLRWSMPSWQMSACTSQTRSVRGRDTRQPQVARKNASSPPISDLSRAPSSTMTRLEKKYVGGLHARIKDLRGRQLLSLLAAHDSAASHNARHIVAASNIHDAEPVFVCVRIDFVARPQKLYVRHVHAGSTPHLRSERQYQSRGGGCTCYSTSAHATLRVQKLSDVPSTTQFRRTEEPLCRAALQYSAPRRRWHAYDGARWALSAGGI